MGMGVGKSYFCFWAKLLVDGVTAYQGCQGNAYGKSTVRSESH